MKFKGIFIIGISLIFPGIAHSIASLQWGTGPDSYIYDENGDRLQPCLRGSYCEPVTPGDKVYLYQDRNCDGADPLTNNDDDIILAESFIGWGNCCLNAGQFSAAITGIPAGTYCLFVRAFNAPDPLNATYYGDSQVQTKTISDSDSTVEMFTESFTTNTPIPTAVFMKDAFALYENNSVHIYWSTGYEINTRGFLIVRYDGNEEKVITPSIIPAKMSPFGSDYHYEDNEVIGGKTYTYYIVEVEFSGTERRYGPISVSIPLNDGVRINEENGRYTVSVMVPEYRILKRDGIISVDVKTYKNLPLSGYILPIKTIHLGMPPGNYTLKIKSYRFKDVKFTGELKRAPCPEVPEIPGIPEISGRCEGEKTAIIGRDGFTPPQVVEVVGDYILREQRVLKINIYAVRINGNTLRITESVEFEVIPEKVYRNPAEDALEKIYSFLNNYIEAKNYRIVEKKSAVSKELPSKYIKVSCKGNGLFSIPFSNLTQYLSSSDIMAEYEGRNWKYHIDGENLIFYLPGFKSYYTDEDTMFLFVGLPDITSIKRSPPTYGGSKGYFTELIRLNADNYLIPAIPVGDDGELWFMKIMNQGQNTIKINIPYPASTSGKLTLKVFSYLDSSNPSAYHHIAVYLNGNYACESIWTGRNWNEKTCNVSGIVAGENTLRIDVLNDGGIKGDMILLDEVKIEYEREFRTDGEEIDFDLEEESNISVCCFSEPPIIARISENGMEEVINGNTVERENGFSVNAHLESGSYIVGVPKNTCSIYQKTPSMPSDETGYEFIIIGEKNFKDALQKLMERREREGLSTTFIDIDEIYDAYSYGRKDPEAIRSFLKDAYLNSKKKPSYALLVGDGSYDPRNIIFSGRDIIPVKFLQTEYFSYHSPSDTYLGTVSGEDIVPDIAIGRIPAETVNDLEIVLKKIEVFEDMVDNGNLPLSSLFVADSDDLGIFEESMNRLKSAFPEDFELTSINWREFNGDKSAILSEIKREVEGGVLFLNYSGHGSVDSWSKSTFITSNDLLTFTNSFPFVLLPQTCLNGYFVVPVLKSLGEAAIFSQGGAVSAWVSSGFTYTISQLALMQSFLQGVFELRVSRIGDAVLYAMGSVEGTEGWEDVVKTWILMGDPTLRLTPIQVSSPSTSYQSTQPKGSSGGSGRSTFRDKGIFSCSEGGNGYSLLILLFIPLLMRLRKV